MVRTVQRQEQMSSSPGLAAETGLTVDIGPFGLNTVHMDTDDIPAIEDIDAVIGARLRHERDSRRLTRAEVAEASGLSAKTVQRIEEGERSADAQQLTAITAVYGLSLYGFMTAALKGTRFAGRARSQSDSHPAK